MDIASGSSSSGAFSDFGWSSAGGRSRTAARILQSIRAKNAAFRIANKTRWAGGHRTAGGTPGLRKIYFPRFFGDRLVSVRSNSFAEAGAGTALLNTMALALTSLP